MKRTYKTKDTKLLSINLVNYSSKGHLKEIASSDKTAH